MPMLLTPLLLYKYLTMHLIGLTTIIVEEVKGMKKKNFLFVQCSVVVKFSTPTGFVSIEWNNISEIGFPIFACSVAYDRNS